VNLKERGKKFTLTGHFMPEEKGSEYSENKHRIGFTHLEDGKKPSAGGAGGCVGKSRETRHYASKREKKRLTTGLQRSSG